MTTAYSINQRVLDPAVNATPAQSKFAADQAAIDFAAELAKSGGRMSMTAGSLPSAPAAFQAKFDRPADVARDAKPAEKVERAETNDSSHDVRRSESKGPERADRPKVRGKDDSKDDGKDDAVATDKVAAKDDGQADAAQTDTADTSGDDQGVDTQAVAQVQQGQDQVQQAAQQIVEAVAAVQAPAEVKAVVADEQQTQVVQQDDKGQQAQVIDPNAGKATEQKQDAQGDAQTDSGQNFQDFAAAAAKGAAKADTHSGAAHEEVQNLAQAQAQDMAASLADTKAQVQVQVQVKDAAATATDGAAQAATTLDALSAQDVSGAQTAALQNGAQGSAQAAPQDQGALTADQGPTIAQAGQNAAQAKSVDVAAVAAATTAQADVAQADGAEQAPATQPVTALNAAGSTQSTQKASSAQAPQAAQQPRMAQHQQAVTDQVTVQIAKGVKDGNDTIKVQLKPVELGAIEVKLSVAKDGTVTGVVTADRPETLAMLQKDSSSLEKALSDAGLKTESGSLSFNLRGDTPQQQQANDNNAFANQQQGNGSPAQQRRSRVASIEAANAEAAQAQAMRSARQSGVNIQV